MNLHSGKSIAHYRLQEQIGQGGMGVVFKAHDTKLDRTVAVKFLPRHISGNEEERNRFKIEAKAAAALNHPNIATIHAIEEVEGEIFIVMEYIEGQELRHLIKSPLEGGAARSAGGVLPIDIVLNYAVQIAAGLHCAHEKGVIHRDIKTSNIMVTDSDQVKIMDFGLAKLLGGAPITKTGAMMGTLCYMSPEQIQGRPVDHRTDIWSMGVIVHEMLCGRLPFQEAYDQVAIYAILTNEPERLTRFRADIPEPVEAIVLKMLQKDPDERYQSAKDILGDLKGCLGQRESTTTQEPLRLHAQPKRRGLFFYGALAALLVIFLAFAAFFPDKENTTIASVAVMPLVNAGGDASMEYLSDGITESLISNLSRSRDLKVMSRHAVFAYKGQPLDPKEVGKKLNVQAVLTGHVIQRGMDLRVSLELVDTRDNRQLWGKQYNRTIGDISPLQEDISKEIYRELQVELSVSEQQELTKRYTRNNEAYQLYLKGRYFWNKYTEEDIKRGIEHFQQAIEKDPRFALAYAALADCYSGLTYFNMRPNEAIPIARAYAEKALQFDDRLAEAHYAFADIKYHYDWDWPGTEAELKRVLELNPNHAPAYELYGRYWLSMGRSDEGIVRLQAALNLDPLSHLTNCYLAMVYYDARDYDRAIQQAKLTLEMESYCAFEYMWIGGSYVEQGRYQEGITELNKTRAQSADWPLTTASLAYAYAVSGNPDEAEKMLSEMRELAKQRYVDPYCIAIVYTGLGDIEQAFTWLDQAVEERSKEIPLLKVEPKLDRLRSDPRFRTLLRKVGLEN